MCLCSVTVIKEIIMMLLSIAYNIIMPIYNYNVKRCLINYVPE